jgi:hypothetical protein
MRELLKKQGFAPKLLVTDKLRPIRFGVPAAAAELPHERGLRRNNRTENSHRAHPLHRGLELRECSRILRCIGMARGYARLPARRGARGTRSGAICVTNGGVMGVSNKRFPLVPPARHAAGDHVAPTLEPNPGAGAPENIGAGIDRIWSAADGLYCSGAGSTARTAPRKPADQGPVPGGRRHRGGSRSRPSCEARRALPSGATPLGTRSCIGWSRPATC